MRGAGFLGAVQRGRAGSWAGRLIVSSIVAAGVVLGVGPAGAGATGTGPVTAASSSDAQCPWVSSDQPIAQRVAQLMSHMTLADEITLVEGHGTTQATTNPYVFYMPGIPRLCIPDLGEEDGPAGVADQLTGVTQLPAGVALAATWNPALARAYGQVIGAEEAGKGASINLGPTVNIDRDPRWGRSFETYTEDPFLNASLATSTIDGVQSQGVMSQVKHFDAYNQETNRNTALDDVIVSDRALHEIYMPAFEAAVNQSKAASVMCAYSSVNGNYSCESPFLLTDVLRQEWDFPGFVTSDYAAIHATSAALAGTDQEQPEDVFFGAALEQAVQTNAIAPAVLNTMVQRILTEMFRFDLISHPLPPTTSATVTSPAHLVVADQVAQAGTTLLKNTGDTLPLSRQHAGTVAVIGPAASVSPTTGGGGSAYVIPSGNVTALAGLQSAAGGGTHLVYQQGLPADASLPAIPASALSPAYTSTPFGGSYSGTLTAPETGTYVLALTNSCTCYNSAYLYLNGKEILDDPGTPPVSVFSAAVKLQAGQSYSVKISGDTSALDWATPSALAPGIAQAVAAARSASRAVVVVSDDTETEAADRPTLDLPSAQNELISAVAAANPHTVVVVNAGAPIAMPWLGQVGAVLDAWFPGQTNGTSLANVIFGEADPGGHLPVTFPANLGQVPAASPSQFPGTDGRVQYSEGVDVGYRWYDAKNLQPLFPFGFGLSYTHFAFSDLQVSRPSVDGVDDIGVSATVTNTGARSGSDVAQLYLADPPAAGEPPRDLVGFQRVTLAPGHSARVQFTITPRDSWWWDQRAGGWSQSAGNYGVYVGDSSALANLPLRGSFAMTSTPAARQVTVDAPSQMAPGQPSTVTVHLSADGDETLHGVSLALQLPQGWSVTPAGPTVFDLVAPSQAPTATFTVTPPTWAPITNAVVHATADLGANAQREAGVTVTLR